MEVIASEPRLSHRPKPEDGGKDVDRDSDLSWAAGQSAAPIDGHILYFSENVDDVNESIGGVILSDTSYYPGRLDFNKTYYWRVDEVNGAPDFTVFPGIVWSFTTEPVAYPIERITATASGSFGPMSTPDKTIDGSGMTDDSHGTRLEDMWLSDALPAWIQYAFDRPYKIQELWIWNTNQAVESAAGFGAKEVVIEYSLDGVNWTVLEGVTELAQAPGTVGYAANNVIDFGGTMARFVRITINSNFGLALQSGLSEVRFLYTPVLARDPHPVDGETEASLDTVLSWRPGREAGSHDIFLSDAMDAVREESAFVATTAETSLDLSTHTLAYGSTYYWKVNEVNDSKTPSVHVGDLWQFTLPEFVSIDDMEAYKDEEYLEIWAHWVDGIGDSANGSVVGNWNDPERYWVHEGEQSMPFVYDNAMGIMSEATRSFDPPLDWIRGEPEVLSLFFLGEPQLIRENPFNDPASLYIRIEDSAGQTAQVIHPDPAATQIESWTEWVIPMQDLSSVDLSSIQAMTLGIGGDGNPGKGKMYFDTIRIGTPTREVP